MYYFITLVMQKPAFKGSICNEELLDLLWFRTSRCSPEDCTELPAFRYDVNNII
jgi:hypothetical protein